MSIISGMKWSIAAFFAVLALSLLSMGLLGAALYYACYPLFAPFYGDLNDWRGDWVWSATVAVGMLWSSSFLAAGWLNLHLEPNVPALARRVVYVLVLWLGAALIWAFFLLTSFQPPQEPGSREAMTSNPEVIACGKSNRTSIERDVAGVFQTQPELIGDPRCLKIGDSGGMVSLMEITSDSAPDDIRFEPASEAPEAPLSLLVDLHPEIFAPIPLSDLQLASILDRERRAGVHLVRLKDGRLFALASNFM